MRAHAGYGRVPRPDREGVPRVVNRTRRLLVRILPVLPGEHRGGHHHAAEEQDSQEVAKLVDTDAQSGGAFQNSMISRPTRTAPIMYWCVRK